MSAARISALIVAAGVALAPATALAAPAGLHHASGPADHHQSSNHQDQGRSSQADHRMAAQRESLKQKLHSQEAELASLRSRIKHSGLSHHERAVLLHHVDALGQHLDGLHHQVVKAGSTRHLKQLSHSVSQSAALLPSQRSELGSLHTVQLGVKAAEVTAARMRRDENRCGNEERPGEMRELDIAIDDLEDAQGLLARQVHTVLNANPESLPSLQKASQADARDSRHALADLTGAVEALISVESHFGR